MPNIVSCPECRKKYKLPDSFNAKRVRCQACGAEFAARYDLSQLNETMAIPPKPPESPKDNPPRRRSNQPTGKQPNGNQPQPPRGPGKESLAKLGLSQIKKQPDLFSDDQSGGPDPLRNHVVQDPGFGNANTKRSKQTQSNAPTGSLEEDVVSNPYMAGTGAGSVDARRQKALKRKKEDELLAGYKNSAVSVDRRPSEFSENGINRTTFWITHFIVNLVFTVIRRSSNALSRFQLEQPSADQASQEPAMAVGVMILLAAFAVLALAACFYGVTTNLRLQNIRFKNPLWKKIATWLAASPWIIWAVAVLMGVLMALSQMLFFLYILLALAIVGLVAFVPSAAVQCIALALPPDYGIHKKLDVPAYIWLGLAILPLVILTLASGYAVIYAMNFF